ncbi:MAG: 2-C-methyl-D-erythritol 2,4-cyclodiphosphate synthase [Candidatus Omnitrophota bacterium]
MYRVGIGYDVHRLVKGRKLFLGGVHLPYKKGLLAHSDGDVLVHAICDALLGAAGEGDIGEHFPDASPRYKNISSLLLLKQVIKLIRRRGFSVENIDAVVIAEGPKLTPFKETICATIGRAMGISLARVNVKATTAEGLGEIGKAQAIAAQAVALLRKGK